MDRRIIADLLETLTTQSQLFGGYNVGVCASAAIEECSLRRNMNAKNQVQSIPVKTRTATTCKKTLKRFSRSRNSIAPIRTEQKNKYIDPGDS